MPPKKFSIALRKKLISKLKDARKQIIEAVNCVPGNKTQALAFGEWTLKDLLSHLSGWAEYQIKVLQLFKKGQEPGEYGSTSDFNRNAVNKRQDKNFDDVKNEFECSSALLIQEYESLTEKQWRAPLWHDKQITPQKFINIEIRHYAQTHLPQIKSL